MDKVTAVSDSKQDIVQQWSRLCMLTRTTLNMCWRSSWLDWCIIVLQRERFMNYAALAAPDWCLHLGGRPLGMDGGVTAFKILFRLETKASELLFRLDSGLSLLKDPCWICFPASRLCLVSTTGALLVVQSKGYPIHQPPTQSNI